MNKNTFLYAGIMLVITTSLGGYLATYGCKTMAEAMIIMAIGGTGVGIGMILISYQMIKETKRKD